MQGHPSRIFTLRTGVCEALQQLTCLTFLDLLVLPFIRQAAMVCDEEVCRGLCAALEQLQSLKRLVINGGCNALPGYTISPVSRITSLTSLELYSFCPDEAGILELLASLFQNMPKLLSLELRSMEPDDGWSFENHRHPGGGQILVSGISCLTQLQSFTVWGSVQASHQGMHDSFLHPKLTKALLQALPPTLTSLELSSSPMTIECYSILAGLTSLQSLFLRNNGVPVECGSSLAALTNLHQLRMFRCEILPEVVRYFLAFTALASLHIDECSSPDGCGALSQQIPVDMPSSLTCLNLSLSVQCVPKLAQLTQLQEIQVYSEHQCTDHKNFTTESVVHALAEHISRLLELKQLSLMFYSWRNVSSTAQAELARSLRTLPNLMSCYPSCEDLEKGYCCM